MFEGWSVIALALGYVSSLFALAWYADRAGRFSKGGNGRPLIYALSLAVYCTSWTFFGSVGNAATTGYDFIPVYLGPILLFGRADDHFGFFSFHCSSKKSAATILPGSRELAGTLTSTMA